MSITEVTNKLNTLGSAWDQFRKVNDARVEELERKGNADPLFMEQLSKINNVLDGQKSRLDMIETAYNRPTREVKNVRFSDGNIEHKKAYESYLRKGAVSDLEAFEKKALSVGSNADGGYLVTPELSKQISDYINVASPMRELASVEEISTSELDVIVDDGTAAAGWVTETASRTDTNTPQIDKKAIPTYELYAQPKATQRLIDDSAVDIEAWLTQKVGEVFSTMENTAFVSGTGSGQPTGILNYASGTTYGTLERVITGSDTAITTDSLVKLQYALKDDYARNATYLMNRSTVQAVRLLKDSTGQYLWQPGLAFGTPDTLFGIPVKQAADMPVIGTGNLAVALGDFKRGYKIVDRIGIRILRDPFSAKPFVIFYATKRVGGDVVNFEAIKILKVSAT